MSSRRDVLKPFEEKQDLLKDRVASGIEANRKGLAVLHFRDAEGRPLPESM